ncbi:MAG: glycosyltransferase family 2 protein [Bacteroidales bacterium]|nr:glycosyltransferase family 2 protein [Bacteroidales bacterium]
MDTAVVILNWNGLPMLQAYLPTLVERTADPGAFIVVADNGSTDGSVAWMQDNWPDIRLITFDRNYGFTGGYNRALREIDADYYVLLNSDIEVGTGWLEPLVGFMEEHPDVGICQPKVLSMAERDRFEYAGACGGFIDRFGYPFCRGRILSNIEKDTGQYDEPEECFWATGACMVVRSALYHHLGGLDELFFAHMEEIDFCWRAKMLGYHVWCVPSSTVWHVGGGTLPNNSPRKLYFNYRNNLLMLYKNLPESIRRVRIFERMLMDGASAAVYLVTGKWEFFKAVCKAHRDYRKLRREEDPSPFEEERNHIGLFPRSIILHFFLSGKKLRWSDIERYLN